MAEVLSTKIEFRKIKVKPSAVHLEFTETRSMKSVDGHGEANEWLEATDYIVDKRLDPLREFHNAMSALKPHLILLCEFFDDIDSIPIEFLASIEVTGISLGGSDEYSGVTITGYRKLRSGKVFNMNAPFTRFNDEENPDAYPLSFEMASAVGEVERCATEYLQGRHAASVQLELFPTEVEHRDREARDLKLEISSSHSDKVIETTLSGLSDLADELAARGAIRPQAAKDMRDLESMGR